MTKENIKERIKSEYRKYADSDIDWIEMAATKIYASLKEEKLIHCDNCDEKTTRYSLGSNCSQCHC